MDFPSAPRGFPETGMQYTGAGPFNGQTDEADSCRVLRGVGEVISRSFLGQWRLLCHATGTFGID